jgi:hypothetical protein
MNFEFWKLGMLQYLRCDGFLEGYKIWTCHGKDPPSLSTSDFTHTNSKFSENDNLQEDDMPGLVHAVLGVVNRQKELDSIGDDTSSS